MPTVLLATDGSDYARQAARRAIEVAGERGATLHVISVVDQRRLEGHALSSAELAAVYASDHATVCVQEVEEMAAASGVSVEGETRHGVPHEAILAYADAVDADVIFVGEHGDNDEHFSGVGRQVRERTDREVRVVGVED
jgi:nucleotide-binding universal stress UspA family protein